MSQRGQETRCGEALNKTTPGVELNVVLWNVSQIQHSSVNMV